VRAGVPPFFIFLAALICVADWAHAQELPRHALEIRALTEPEEVLQILPQALDSARARGDAGEEVALQLARANACRVIANWPCQREAGLAARELADAAKMPIPALRGMIAEARGAIAMQDYSLGGRILSDAGTRLKATPSPELGADVSLAFSSFSHQIGKHALAKSYAERGLAELGQLDSPPMRARLLRNMARAQALLGDIAAARLTLAEGLNVTERMFDPKLSAEMHIEAARIARQLGDIPEQRRNAARILEFAERLKNSQLAGLGHEVMGLSAISENDFKRGNRELTISLESFRALKLTRDELRVIRELLELAVQRRATSAEFANLVSGYLRLDREVTEADRAQAADDFEARFKYAQAEIEVKRLEAEATFAREREQASAQQARLRGLAAALAVLAIAVLAGFFAQQWRLNRRLKVALLKQRESESRARELIELTDGFVLLHDPNGRLLMVNPAVSDALGGDAVQLVGRSWPDFLTTESRAQFSNYLSRLRSDGRADGMLTVRHGDKSERHWRYSATLGGDAYVIVNAVDITAQVEESSALREQSLRDALTRAYNRRFLELFESSQPASAHWGVIVLDLDRFKRVNDTFGHAEGDRILLQTANLLRAVAPRDGAVVRLGGDEFALLLARSTEGELSRVCAQLNQRRGDTKFSFSLGTAMREPAEKLEQTLARADQNMYRTRIDARADNKPG